MKKSIHAILIIFIFYFNLIYAQKWVNICPSFIPEDIYGLDGVFKNEYEGWIIGVGELPQRLYRTTDGGITWNIQMSKDSIFYSDLSFVNDNYGWMKVSKWVGPNLNYEYFLYRTNNGGIAWMPVSNPPDSAFYAITFVDSLIGFSGGTNAIYKTTDGGESWVIQDFIGEERFGIHDIYFVDKQYGWAVGGSSDFTDCGIILNTIDSGKTWQTQLPITLPLRAVCFSNRVHGCAVGLNVFGGGIVLITNDSGKNWQVIYLPSPWLNDVVLTDDSTGWVVGEYGYIGKTEDGGQTWNQVESGIDADLNRIVFVDSGNVGYIFGENNTLLKYDKYGNSVEDRLLSPNQFELHQNYPNPFNSQTVITYKLDKAYNVSVKVYDIMGREVSILVNRRQMSGSYQAVWDGKDKQGKEVGSGIYLIGLRAGSYNQVRKMTLNR